MLRTSITIFLMILTTGCGRIFQPPAKKVTFRVLTSAVPDSIPLFITGIQPETGTRSMDSFRLQKESDSIRTQTFSFKTGTHFEYKLVRGLGSGRRGYESGIELFSGDLFVQRDTTINMQIPEGVIFTNFRNDFSDRKLHQIRVKTIYQMVFTVVPLTLALLHLLLFVFYPPLRENLFYALSMLSFGLLTFSNFQPPFIENADEFMIWGKITFASMNFSVIFGLLTFYMAIDRSLPRRSLFFIGSVAVFLIWSLFQFNHNLFNLFYFFLFVTTIEILRLVLFSGFRKNRRNELICLGFLVLIGSIIYQILIEFGLLLPVGGNPVVYVYGVLILSILFSVDLARSYARTNRDFEKQLEQVRALSEKNLEQERKVKDEEITRRLLEADNARKTQELEEARKLQLAMLPKTIPSLPHLDIAVYMKTATEVGGDYYDFDLAEDGTLTVAIGDATGHGIKAGIMVTLMKNLFNAFGQSFYIPDFFNHCTKIIKGMSLGNLYMGLLLLRIKLNKITLAAAGMPPVYIYRKQKKIVEEILLKGMPLGGFRNFSYKQIRTELAPGDTILLLSDGFLELFNNQKEMLDYERTQELFCEAAEKSAEQIIKYLTEAGEKWRQGFPQADDVTFVIIKYKESGGKHFD